MGHNASLVRLSESMRREQDALKCLGDRPDWQLAETDYEAAEVQIHSHEFSSPCTELR